MFGYFCRRCFVSFNKLSFLGIAKLQEGFLAWAGGNNQVGYGEVPKEVLRDGKVGSTQDVRSYVSRTDDYILRPQFDRESYAVADAYGE